MPNIESKITQLRLLESQLRINDWSEDAAAEIFRRYKSAVAELTEEIGDEADLERIISGLSAQTAVPVSKAFAVAGSASLADASDILSWDGNYKGFRPVAISKQQLQGLAMAERINGQALTAHLSDAIGKEARKLITDARTEGKGIRSMTAEIYDALGGAVSRRNIETLSRTYTATASSYARELLYRQNDDIIKGFRLNATLENGNFRTGRGTCPRCAGLDQRVYSKTATRPPLPMHPNCLCIWTPETETWKALGLDIEEMSRSYRPWAERAENGRKLAGGTFEGDFGDWWSKKSKEWQDKSTVGPTRAALIREGKIGFEDLVEPSTGRLYTIKELLKR
jgi:hypothetical protein